MPTAAAPTTATPETVAPATVVSVSQDSQHRFSKPPRMWIRLIAGLGVEGDAHLGVTVQHLYRVAKNPNEPNLRQVHLIHRELFDELAAAGFTVGPGDMGENIVTRHIDLLNLPDGTELQLGAEARIRLTGLRNPCIQLNRFQPGLMAATLGRGADGNLIRKAGVMAVVLAGGEVRPGDPIQVFLPPEPHRPMQPV